MKYLLIGLLQAARKASTAYFTVAKKNTLSSIFEKTALGLGLGTLFKNGLNIEGYIIAIVIVSIILSVVLSTDKED